MSLPSPERRSIEELWLVRLRIAEQHYAYVREQLRKVLKSFPASEVPSPDRSGAYQQAQRAENLALDEYRRVLQIFTDLVVHGKIPEED